MLAEVESFLFVEVVFAVSEQSDALWCPRPDVIRVAVKQNNTANYCRECEENDDLRALPWVYNQTSGNDAHRAARQQSVRAASASFVALSLVQRVWQGWPDVSV